MFSYFNSINTNKDYIEPLAIKVITKDIIFNYNCDSKSSSSYVTAMINNGWEVNMLSSNSKKILIEICKENQTCKILIGGSKLKVYLKQLVNSNIMNNTQTNL